MKRLKPAVWCQKPVIQLSEQQPPFSLSSRGLTGPDRRLPRLLAPDMLAPVIILRECEERESFLCNEKKCNGAALAQTNRSKVWGVNRWLGSLSSDVFERRTSTGNWLFAHLSRDFEQIFGQIVSVRIKTLGNTNTVASRLTKRENGSLPVDVRRSKTWLLKLPTATSPLRATEQKIN